MNWFKVCKDGDLENLRSMPFDLLTVNGRDVKNGCTPLYYAVSVGNIDCVLFLIYERKADLNITSFKGDTALDVACWNGDLELVRILIGNGAKVSVEKPTEKKHETALFYASQRGFLNCIKELVAHGAADDPLSLLGAFQISCRQNHLEIAKYFLQETQITVDEKWSDGGTALMIACQEGHLEIAKFLAHASANIQEKSNNGYSSFLWACLMGRLDIVRFLLETDPSVTKDTTPGNNDALFLASEKGHRDVVQVLVEQGMTIELGSFQVAAHFGHVEVIKYLLQEFENKDELLNGKWSDGSSTLMIGVFYNHFDVVRFLIEKGSSLTDQWEGKSPLQLAKEKECWGIARLILWNQQVWPRVRLLILAQRQHTPVTLFTWLPLELLEIVVLAVEQAVFRELPQHPEQTSKEPKEGEK